MSKHTKGQRKHLQMLYLTNIGNVVFFFSTYFRKILMLLEFFSDNYKMTSRMQKRVGYTIYKTWATTRYLNTPSVSSSGYNPFSSTEELASTVTSQQKPPFNNSQFLNSPKSNLNLPCMLPLHKVDLHTTVNYMPFQGGLLLTVCTVFSNRLANIWTDTVRLMASTAWQDIEKAELKGIHFSSTIFLTVNFMLTNAEKYFNWYACLYSVVYQVKQNGSLLAVMCALA